jgi:hypothetical protein
MGDRNYSLPEEYVWAPALDAEDRRVFFPFRGQVGGISARIVPTRAQALDVHYPDFFRTLWERRIGTPAAPANLGPDGDVYFATTQSTLFRLDGETGSTEWSRTGMGPIRTMPVFSRDDATLIVSTGRAVRGVRAQDGALLWRRQLPTTAGAPAVAADGTVLVGTAGGEVFGINPTDGRVRWSRALPGSELAAPATFENLALFAAGSVLYALSSANGSLLWSATLPGSAITSPSASPDGLVYISSGQWVSCYNRNGDLQWSNKTTAIGNLGEITVGEDGSLFVARRNGPLVIRRRYSRAGMVLHGFGVGVPEPPVRGPNWPEQLIWEDGNFLRLRATRNPKEPTAIAKVTLQALSVVSQVLDVEFRQVDRSVHTGPVERRIHAYDWAASKWKLIDRRPVGTQFSLTRLNHSFADQPWIGPFWVTYYAQGDVSSSAVEIDQLTVSEQLAWWNDRLPQW